ncbi:MAG: tryptophan--tRNA ligase [Bacilli bacterium]|nr:tryptophan--tRNA ligase [Bacilli bacterium]
MKRMLTGLQPTGEITLGNYIGAIRQMVEYQEKYDSFIFVADMHAITIEQDPAELKKNIRNLLAIYLACGIDKDKNTIFLQSENVYHANLSWMLECLTPYGELTRMTQFKDKSQKHKSFSSGLLTYPVLMASDILIYDTDLVPVGQDQKQHVELARNIADRVNKKYNKELFTMPDALIGTNSKKIMDLIDPTHKMSKSSENKNGVIFLLDSDEDIRKKIMRATTDSDMSIKFDPDNKPGISNLINIYSALSNLSVSEVEEKFKDSNYGTFKASVAELVIDTLRPIKEKYEMYQNSSKIDEILDNGLNVTSKIAREKYELLKQTMGLTR